MVSLLFVGLVITILITPGPTNTLLASSGIQVGIKSSLKLIPSEVLGYFIAISLWGLFIQSVSDTFPWLLSVLKLISATYIAFLAVKLWLTSTDSIQQNQSTISIKNLFFATLLNPKALLFASVVFPATAWTGLHQYIVHMATFLALIIPIAFLWVVFGSVLISNKVKWLNQRNLQRGAALILMCFCMPLGYSAVSSL